MSVAHSPMKPRGTSIRGVMLPCMRRKYGSFECFSMSRGLVNESPVRMLLLCRGCPGRFGPGIGDGCRSDVAWELMLTYGGFPSASDSCKLVVVLVLDIMKEKNGLQNRRGESRFRKAVRERVSGPTCCTRLEKESLQVLFQLSDMEPYDSRIGAKSPPIRPPMAGSAPDR